MRAELLHGSGKNVSRLQLHVCQVHSTYIHHGPQRTPPMTHQTTDNLPPTHGTPKRSNSMVPDGTSWDPVSVIHGWGQGGGVIHQLRRPPQPKPRKHAGAVAALHLHSCNTLKCKCSTLIAGERERERGGQSNQTARQCFTVQGLTRMDRAMGDVTLSTKLFKRQNIVLHAAN